MASDDAHHRRGPQGRLHYPTWTADCYYERESACALCLCRLWWGVVVLAGRTALGRLADRFRGGDGR